LRGSGGRLAHRWPEGGAKRRARSRRCRGVSAVSSPASSSAWRARQWVSWVARASRSAAGLRSTHKETIGAGRCLVSRASERASRQLSADACQLSAAAVSPTHLSDATSVWEPASSSPCTVGSARARLRAAAAVRWPIDDEHDEDEPSSTTPRRSNRALSCCRRGRSSRKCQSWPGRQLRRQRSAYQKTGPSTIPWRHTTGSSSHMGHSRSHQRTRARRNEGSDGLAGWLCGWR
jgi:hypothetical protein